MEQNEAFWAALDTLVEQSAIVIDRPKGTAHPRYPDFVYPVDYGYLDSTSSMDGGGIDVWLGSEKERLLDAVMCIVDLTKRDSEIKLLVGCTEQEKELVFQVHNQTQYMKGVLIRRR
jgi:inorganic pyrophosphatase